jgi:N-acyl homoserine lactone hydrolase
MFLFGLGSTGSGQALAAWYELSLGDPSRVPFVSFGLQPLLDTSEHLSPYLADPTSSPIHLTTLLTGEVIVPVKGMLNPENEKTRLLLVRGSHMKVSVYSHWLHHRVIGDLLIDTGMDRSFQKSGNVCGMMANDYIHSSRQMPGQNIGDQLAKLGVRPEAVLYTHLHGDHSAGTPELTKDSRFIVGKDEKYINVPLFYWREHLKGVRQLEEIDISQCPIQPMIGQACDLIGDKSLFAISTPGHSSGHLSFVLMSDAGPVLLTGDVSHTKFGFDEDIEPGWADDRELAIQSLRRIKQIAKDVPGLKVIFGHQDQKGSMEVFFPGAR